MSEGIWMKKTLVAAVAAGTLVLAGCNSDDKTEPKATNNTENTTTNPDNFASVNNPRGSITGLVTDTNGNPIEGATVYLGNQSVTTNIGGQYYFDEVAVTQTVKNDTDNYSQALALTIVPPSGYLKATVTVTPQAQIFNGNDGSDNSVENPITTFIDGFNASAGTAVVPALTATVNGVLRDADTGEALGDVPLALDMTGTATGTAQEQNQDGVSTSYGTGSYTVVTNTDGSFSFANIPADSELSMSASGYTVAATADTSAEHTTVELGVVAASPVLGSDIIAPWVKFVPQVVDQTAGRGMLDDDTDREITVVFSETIDTSKFDENSLRVRDVDAGEYLEHTATLSGNTLTITISETKDGNPQDGLLARAGNEIDLLLLKDDLRDTGSPASGLGITDGNGDPSLVGFDYAHGISGGGTYVRLELKAFSESNMDATQVTEFTQESQDNTGVDDLELAQAENHAFLDINDSIANIQQLNAAKDGNADGDSDSATRLGALLAQLADTASLEGTAAVEVDSTLVHFTPTNASAYLIEIRDSQGDSKWNGLAAKELKGLGELDNGVDPDYGVITADGSNAVELYLDGVVPGDQVVVTPLDDFGYSGTVSVLTLVDNVAPTTVLQKSYGIGDDDNGQVTSRRYGNGGEQSAELDVAVGTPYYDLTPRLLGEVDGTEKGPEDEEAYIRTFKRLYSFNTVNPVGSSNPATIGEEFIDPAIKVYDKTAFSAYTGQSGYFERTLGVAFSEDLDTTLVGEPLFTPVTGTVIPTAGSYFVQNDVAKDDNADEIKDVDLVSFDLSNIYTFALEESGAVMDFTGVVSDMAGNVATADYNAKVVVRDLIPPMVESAQYTGSALTVVFDKPIDISAIDGQETAMTLNGIAIDLSDASNYDWDEETRTLVVYRSDNKEGDAENLGYAAFNLVDTFNLAQYNDGNPSGSVASDSLRHTHGALEFRKIPNLNGATWETYNDLHVASSEGGFEAPKFAVQNLVETFSVENGTDSISDAAGISTVTVSYKFSHEVDWSGADSNDNGVLNPSEVAGLFTFTDVSGGGVGIDTSDSNTAMQYTVGSDGAITYTFKLVMTGAVEGGVDTLDLKALPSAYELEEAVDPADPDVPVTADAVSITL